MKNILGFPGVLEVITFIVGGAVSFYLFSFAFFGDDLNIALILILQALLALLLGWGSFRLLPQAKGRRVFQFLLLESGMIVMGLVGGFNLLETGSIGFTVLFWILPICIDLLLWWIGIKLAAKRTFANTHLQTY